MSTKTLQKFFDDFLPSFKKTSIWSSMKSTVENSPWHREASVATHTEMVLKWYRQNVADQRTSQMHAITLFALLFHDVGKPTAEEQKTREDGTVYRSYGGHEHDSAVAWIDYATSNKSVLQDFNLSPSDVSNIAFIIEYHLPYSLKKADKVKALQDSLSQRFGQLKMMFIDALRSDQNGRISDNHEKNQQEMEAWIADFTKEWK